jgi:hypothetical protein
MEALNVDVRRKIIAHFYSEHREKGKKFTIDHFKLHNIGKSTVYRICQRVDDGQQIERVKGQGRKKSENAKKMIKELKTKVADKLNRGKRWMAKEWKLCPKNVQNILKEQNYKCYKPKKVGKASKEKLKEQRIRCRSLSRNVFVNRKVVIDDESYFTVDGSECNRNSFYYTQNKERTPDDIKFRSVEKYPKKVMVWLAGSEFGLSEPYFVPSGGGVDSEKYITHCIEDKFTSILGRIPYKS